MSKDDCMGVHIGSVYAEACMSLELKQEPMAELDMKQALELIVKQLIIRMTDFLLAVVLVQVLDMG